MPAFPTACPFAIVAPRNKDRHLAAAVANRLIAFLDPPEHTPPRKLIAKTFVAHVKEKEPMVRQAAEELLAGIRPGSFDFVRDFATPYSMRCVVQGHGLSRRRTRRA